MDSKVESGRDPAPEAGIGQGCTGGSVAPGGGEVHDSKTPPVLAVGDIVYLRWQGGLLQCRTEAFQTFGGAINVSNGNGEYIVKREDLITEDEHLANLFAENRSYAARQYSRVLDAWSTGLRTSKEIAVATSWERREVAGALKSLAHWKLIELPKKEEQKESKPE